MRKQCLSFALVLTAVMASANTVLADKPTKKPIVTKTQSSGSIVKPIGENTSPGSIVKPGGENTVPGPGGARSIKKPPKPPRKDSLTNVNSLNPNKIIVPSSGGVGANRPSLNPGKSGI